MIALTLEKGFREVSTWDEVFEMPGYTNSLNPEKEELKQILGKYEFLTYEKCGLSNCGTPHGKGYIVETTSGKLTNIGSYCGKKHFSVEFENLSRDFDRYYRDHKARERIETFQRTINSKLSEVANIENDFGSIDTAYKIQQFFKGKSKNHLKTIVQRLSKMVKDNDPNIYIDKMLSKEEINAREVSGQKNIPKYERVVTDSITGLDFLYEYNDLRLLYVIEFKNPLEEIEKLNVDNLLSRDLDFWSKKIGEIDGNIRRIREVMEEGYKFLQLENMIKITSKKSEDFKYLLFILNADYSIRLK
ncbi:hypothetical protein [Psychrobacter immobilis]|jgi:hypothetical protein|uniref:hypothetical protein n=1 Tax=Psychrobacter immobilis TaxID=498 RepID=UPI00191A4579|nr:hypothetical protein [Psychrobacter immobilis]